jgi:hypothetical protein
MLNRSLITLDVDWAPDFAIELAARVLIESRIKATWFITHMSPAIESLRKRSDLFELGVHPNFLPGSSHGDSVKEVLEYVMRLVPDAISMRSHSAYQSGPMLNEVTASTRIRFDSSIFLPEMSYISPVEHLTPNGSIYRIPFFWADDYEMLKQRPAWRPERYKNVLGIKIFMFHPIHIALNSIDHGSYVRVKQRYQGIDCLPKEEIPNSSDYSAGCRTFFLELVGFIKNTESEGYMLKEVVVEK